MMQFDYSEIKEQFIKVIEHSQNIPEPKVDQLFEKWYEAKKNFINAFNEKLIYEMEEPFSFELSEESRTSRINSFIDYCWSKNLGDLGDFILAERAGFFANKCEKDYRDVKQGTKLVKAFKYFIEDPDVLQEMQSRASQIIQENKVSGKLCFSVHPLDYLSISETTYNWRSCHALDGEYRAGNLSYMMDSSTVVCYLKGEEEAVLPNFPEDVLWNSKKWRVLLYVSNDWKMVAAGKQYPFTTNEGMDTIIDKCFNARGDDGGYYKPNKSGIGYRKSKWSHWTDFYYKDNVIDNIIFDFSHKHYIPIGDGIKSFHEIMIDEEGSKQFNDTLKSSCYFPMYTFLLDNCWCGVNEYYTLAHEDKTRFHVGGFTYCLRCGKAEVMASGSSSMMCYDCEKLYGNSTNEYFCFCSECGRRIETETGWWIEDDYYCPECADRLSHQCEQCGDYYLTENMVYNEKEDAYYCHWCGN